MLDQRKHPLPTGRTDVPNGAAALLAVRAAPLSLCLSATFELRISSLAHGPFVRAVQERLGE